MTQTNGDSVDPNLVSERIKKLQQSLVQEKGITDYKIEIEPGSIKGDNYLGIIAKSVITGKDANGKPVTLNLIIKSASKSEGLRNFAPIRLAYEREIYMYSYVLPQFHKFQIEKGIKNPFTSYAKCLKTSFENMDEALIMEDMKALGYVMQNRKNALDYNHVKMVITELARYHAISFAIRDQKPELIEKLGKDMEKNFMSEMDINEFSKHSAEHCKKALDALDPEKDKEAIKKFEKFMETYVDDFIDILTTKEDSQYKVVRHGDCWTNNFLFAYNDKNKPNEPSKVCFLDWQLSYLGSPVLDLLYFIYSCTDKKLRSAHFDQLLKDYHQTLKEFGAELGSDIDKLYPYTAFLQQMKKYGKYGMTIAVMLVHLMTSESEEVPDINKVFEEENVTKAMEAFNFKSKNIDEYNTRIRDVILHLIEKDYF